jgi:hypothetical protein
VTDLRAIERAQVRAGEMVVLESLHSRGLCMEGCPICHEEKQPKISDSLADKLAMMVWYLEEVRRNRRKADPEAFQSYLDDPEVALWLDKMNKANRVRNTRFTEKR